MHSNIINSLRLAALTVCAIAALLCAREAQADTFTVTAIIDAPDAVPGDGKCETGPGNGVCTLRAAVMEANALAGEDVIQLPADYIKLTRTGEDEGAYTGNLDIYGRLTIRGVQSDTSRVAGPHISSTRGGVFEIHPLAVVSMTDFAIQDGLASDGGGVWVQTAASLHLENMIIRNNWAGDGGGIFNSGVVRVSRSLISANAVLGDDPGGGGGISDDPISPGDVSTTIEDSIIRDNKAFFGGGIAVRRQSLVLNSLIQGNSSYSDGGGIAAGSFTIIIASRIYSNSTDLDGGGVSLNGGLIADSHIAWNSARRRGGGVSAGETDIEETTITIVRTTISNNRADAGPFGGEFGGGGVFTGHTQLFNLIDSAVVDNSAVTGGGIHRNGGGINVINTTVSGNVAAGRGGGIALELNVCTGFCEVGLYNATVANNAAASASDGVYVAPGVQLRAQNSIIASNNDADCEGTILSGGYNLIENTAGCSFLGLAIYDVLGVDPKPGRLALNGGPTLNHLPGRDSPTINAGNPGGCSSPTGAKLVTDQRGLPRTAGRRCDIGAVEVQPEAAPEWLVFLPIVMR